MLSCSVFSSNGKPWCCLAALVAILLAAVGPAVCDVEPPVLAKYKKPLDESVDKALAYLASVQIPPGQPVAGSFACTPDVRGNSGITSLCVMAFLSKGHTPGLGPYGDVINRGIDYVLSTHDTKTNLLIGPDASSGRPMYAHCISTLMLAEVSGMVDPERQKKIDLVLPKALNLIVSAQRVPKGSNQGGWRYYPTSDDADISLTGWAAMALRSGRLNGAAIPKECIGDAIQYILKCRTSDGGFAYQPHGGSGLARTGVGVLCLELCGQHGNPDTISGGEYILRNMPRTATLNCDVFYYGEYYCSQAMFQLGGKYWETWAPVMYEMFFKAQRSNGSWPPDYDSVAGRYGPAYSTAMAVLAMTLSYRQLPIYQR